MQNKKKTTLFSLFKILNVINLIFIKQIGYVEK